MTKDDLITQLITRLADARLTLKCALEESYEDGRRAGLDTHPRMPPGISSWEFDSTGVQRTLSITFMNGVKVVVPFPGYGLL